MSFDITQNNITNSKQGSGRGCVAALALHKQRFALMTSQISGPCCDSDIEPDQYKSFVRGTQLEYSSKALKHSIVKRILVFKR